MDMSGESLLVIRVAPPLTVWSTEGPSSTGTVGTVVRLRIFIRELRITPQPTIQEAHTRHTNQEKKEKSPRRVVSSAVRRSYG
jgi:hypothetical protein